MATMQLRRPEALRASSSPWKRLEEQRAAEREVNLRTGRYVGQRCKEGETAGLVFAAMLEACDDDGLLQWSLSEISYSVGVTRFPAFSALRRLQSAGMLRVVKHGRRGAVNTYFIPAGVVRD